MRGWSGHNAVTSSNVLAGIVSPAAPLTLSSHNSAGLPVASTAVPEVLRYRAHCAIERDAAGFEAAIARLLAEDTPVRRRARSDAMRAET